MQPYAKKDAEETAKRLAAEAAAAPKEEAAPKAAKGTDKAAAKEVNPA